LTTILFGIDDVHFGQRGARTLTLNLTLTLTLTLTLQVPSISRHLMHRQVGLWVMVVGTITWMSTV
jgi:hypothetical protein